MKRDAKQEALDLFVIIYQSIPDFVIIDNKIASSLAKQCAIIAQQRILELDVWNCNSEEELNHQREILKELEKL